MDRPIPAEELPATTRALAHVLAKRLQLPDGRVEVIVERGQVTLVWRHERVTTSQLARFDDGGPEAIAAELLEAVQLFSRSG